MGQEMSRSYPGFIAGYVGKPTGDAAVDHTGFPMFHKHPGRSDSEDFGERGQIEETVRPDTRGHRKPQASAILFMNRLP